MFVPPSCDLDKCSWGSALNPRGVSLFIKGAMLPAHLWAVLDILEYYAERRIRASLWSLWMP